jgi:hypothetical protein
MLPGNQIAFHPPAYTESVAQRSPGLPTFVGNPGHTSDEASNPAGVVQTIPPASTNGENSRNRRRSAKCITTSEIHVLRKPYRFRHQSIVYPGLTHVPWQHRS